MIEVNGCKFHKLTQEKVDWVKENYHLKITDICKHIGSCDETVQRLLKALGIDRERHYTHKIPKTPEAMADLANPYMSHAKIAEKYGVHETSVGHLRKRMGLGVRRNMSSTRLEDAIQKVLDKLDLAYVPQKQINQWSIDFYLGRGYCIDVHGEWAHTRKNMPKRDARKTKDLNDMGYKYLVVYERELDQARQMIQDFTKGFPHQ